MIGPDSAVLKRFHLPGAERHHPSGGHPPSRVGQYPFYAAEFAREEGELGGRTEHPPRLDRGQHREDRAQCARVPRAEQHRLRSPGHIRRVRRARLALCRPDRDAHPVQPPQISVSPVGQDQNTMAGRSPTTPSTMPTTAGLTIAINQGPNRSTSRSP